MPEPALAAASDCVEIDAVDDAGQSIASAQHQRDIGIGIGGDALDRREPRVVGRGKTLPAAIGRRVEMNAVTEARQSRDRARDSRRVGREACGGEDVEAHGDSADAQRRAAKNSVSSDAQASSATPPTTLV